MQHGKVKFTETEGTPWRHESQVKQSSFNLKSFQQTAKQDIQTDPATTTTKNFQCAFFKYLGKTKDCHQSTASSSNQRLLTLSSTAYCWLYPERRGWRTMYVVLGVSCQDVFQLSLHDMTNLDLWISAAGFGLPEWRETLHSCMASSSVLRLRGELLAKLKQLSAYPD